MRRNRHVETTLSIRGVGLVDVVTVTGLAQIVGKSRNSILRYEENDILPPAPIVAGTVRYYPVTLARKLAPIIAGFPGNRRPSPETIVEINKLFKEEKNRLCQEK